MRALISVSDKTGIVEFAKELVNLGIEIISTGGTYKKLKEEGIEAIEISELTGFPECLDGRVKTLHPIVHAGLLAMRSNEEHMKTLKELNIETIDFVIVNLYPLFFKYAANFTGNSGCFHLRNLAHHMILVIAVRLKSILFSTL